MTIAFNPRTLAAQLSAIPTIDVAIRLYVQAVRDACGGNITATARALQTNRWRVYTVLGLKKRPAPKSGRHQVTRDSDRLRSERERNPVTEVTPVTSHEVADLIERIESEAGRGL